MAFVITQQDLFPTPILAKMSQEIRKSNLLGRSQLVGGFKQTAGFGLAFTMNGYHQVREQLPELLPFLDHIVESKPSLRVQPAWRTLSRQCNINAFYVNVLCMRSHHGVTRHIDATLQKSNHSSSVIPRAVSVLYLSAPQHAGGHLRIFVNQILHSEIQPQPGLVVHFRGNLSHEVTALSETAEERMSLVCEQYALSTKALSQLPPFQVQSRALDPIFGNSDSNQSFGDLLRVKSRRAEEGRE